MPPAQPTDFHDLLYDICAIDTEIENLRQQEESLNNYRRKLAMQRQDSETAALKVYRQAGSPECVISISLPRTNTHRCVRFETRGIVTEPQWSACDSRFKKGRDGEADPDVGSAAQPPNPDLCVPTAVTSAPEPLHTLGGHGDCGTMASYFDMADAVDPGD
jgi:hypothetical protein